MARSLGVSEKRLLGWEPTEVAVHEYDNGRMIRTIVTRESEWDDAQRANMQALAQFEAETCECGFHFTIADADPDLEIAIRVCPVCAAATQKQRILHAADEAATKARGDKAPAGQPRREDGRHLSLRPKPIAPAKGETT